MNESLYESHFGWKNCLPILLRIVNFFLKGENIATITESVDLPSFIHMLLKLLINVAKLLDSDSVVIFFILIF